MKCPYGVGSLTPRRCFGRYRNREIVVWFRGHMVILFSLQNKKIVEDIVSWTCYSSCFYLGAPTANVVFLADKDEYDFGEEVRKIAEEML